ncbi:DUF1223 domain-containing protein [Vitiosangium sp. GDMCC 1.1324]|uniref:DUF1223 domain-containing protein n=1 Tax=Vitiosangium sp. (strain GDMCC 1.1324) TaxID=2138576 RepID=UPI000D38AF21|nr:DUF1223 domain-containing protein [Vitiosangium sp. GDMCC 1.1324]PTL84095.1 hypothetical protein DAT35_11650 [Vitiosangium sp. GDMCC 1.1324]
MTHAPLLALALVLTAGEPRPPTPVLVELFTSEACDNCPSKEELLARLAKTQPVAGVELIPLAFHMDAYDGLGWKDRFGLPDATQRQRRYNAVHNHGKLFAPHMVVDGVRSFLANEEQARAQVTEASHLRKAPVRLTARTEKNELVLEVHLDAKPEQDVEVWAALVEDGLSTKVTAGPNKGRTLIHAATVRTWAVLPPPASEANGFTTQARLRLEPAWKRERMRVVVALQKPWGGRVEGLASQMLGTKP